MFIVFSFFFITFALSYLFHLLTKESIAEAYAKLPGRDNRRKKVKAFFIGVFRLIAF